MEKMNSIEQYNEIISKENVILMFSADWCPDCRVIEPILPELEAENSSYT
ncbi:thioredoxin family protein, partial [Metabacillus fastidiosus]